MAFILAVTYPISKRSQSSLPPHIKHVLDILTCTCDCVIHFTLPDTFSVLVKAVNFLDSHSKGICRDTDDKSMLVINFDL